MKKRLPRLLDRIMPVGMFGRLVMVMVMGLVLEQAISGFIFFEERRDLEMQSRSVRMAERVADLVKLLDGMSAEERLKFTPLAESRYFSVDLPSENAFKVPTEGYEENREKLQVLEQTLAQLLGRERVLTVALASIGASGGYAAFPPLAAGQVSQLVPGVDEHDLHSPVLFAVVSLADGSRAGFRYIVPGPLPATVRNFVINMLVRLAVIIALSLVAVRIATRPLALLAQAAERLGRDIHEPPLVEAGPVEVQQAAWAFNRMQERLLTILRDRTRMLAAISHDLKTPITRLRLRAELLDDQTLKDKLIKDLAEMETMVSATLEFMHNLDDLGPTQSIDMVAMLESMQADAAEIGQPITVSGNAEPFSGHALPLRRCLANLLDNAVKYGHKAEVLIQDSDDALTIRVRDQGPGIPEDKLIKVFEPFYRLEESRNRDTGGHGLGLSIALSCAQSHGGTLVLSNRPEGGLEAELILPRGGV